MGCYLSSDSLGYDVVRLVSASEACWHRGVRRLAPILLVFVGASPGCSEEEVMPVTPWRTGTAFRTHDGPNARGFVDVRGLIHAHSVYSHDACDGEPVKDGVRDQACFDDFRRGLCIAKHDFVMLSDHDTYFSETPFEEALLHRAERGDVFIERDGQKVASWASCPTGERALVLAGFESGTLSVGLSKHLDEGAARSALYDSREPAAIERLKREADAVVLLQHTEDYSSDTLSDLPIDGFEMYNLHANTLRSAGQVLELIVITSDRPAELPASDLIALPLLGEDPRYLERWGTVLARGHRRVGTMGTDCHQNVFQGKLPDGERGDSYRRMMMWLSNHLLVRRSDKNFDDRDLKEALRAGRNYGAFEVMGYPVGFDFHAERDGEVFEMGEELSAGPVDLVMKMPEVQALDPSRTPPTKLARILRAIDGGFEEIARGDGDLRVTVTSTGAYRAEVRMIPHHLKEDFGIYFKPSLVDKEMVWIYANPIYLR